MSKKYLFEDSVALVQISKIKDSDFIDFINLYKQLYDLRLLVAGINHILNKEEVWPKINSANTAIYEYLQGNSMDNYKQVSRYIMEVYSKDINQFCDEQRGKYKELISKFNLSQQAKLKYEHTFKIMDVMKKYAVCTNILYNDILVTTVSAYYYMYFNSYLEAVIEEQRVDRKRHSIGVILGVTGIVLSVILGIISIVLGVISLM